MTTTLFQCVICPFTVAVSSNETAHGSAYRFDNIPAREIQGGGVLYVPTTSKYLVTGDYSIEGLEDRVCVERKTLEDLFGTLGKGRERFALEFERMAVMEHAAVVIEANWQEICRPLSC